jgi:putative transposase
MFLLTFKRQPIELWTEAIFQQKVDYTHNNLVAAGFVENNFEYLYSTARDYCGIKGLVKVIID